MNASRMILALLLLPLHSVGQLKPISLSVNNVAIYDTAVHEAIASAKRLTIQLDHNPVDTILYQCQLEGADDHWLTYRRAISLSYADLPGGSYRFVIRRPGQPIFRHISVLIDPQLWQRWWFLPSVYFFAFSLLAIGLYFSYLYKMHQQIRMQQVRDRIARDLHDDMGSYLSSISIMSEMGQRNALRDPEKTGKTLEKIGYTARQIMDSMSDMVWSINPSHDSMAHVITRMTDVGNNLFADTAIDFQFQIDQDVGTFPLTAEARRDLFLIYKEALTNATRYAGASRVRAALQRTQVGLTLSIQDDGRGFNPQQPDYQNPGGGNGIRNMQTRASILGAQLAITSGVGEGTSIHLMVPAGSLSS